MKGLGRRALIILIEIHQTQCVPCILRGRCVASRQSWQDRLDGPGEPLAASLPARFHRDDLYMTGDKTEACGGQGPSSRPPSCWRKQVDSACAVANVTVWMKVSTSLMKMLKQELFKEETEAFPALGTSPRLCGDARSLPPPCPQQVRLDPEPTVKQDETTRTAVWTRALFFTPRLTELLDTRLNTWV